MRIIAGKHRTRRLVSPEDDTITRPLTDRVKEILFNRLMARGLLGGGYVADIFAGVGSLGLEALSRGAEHVTFIERHRQIRTLLEQNIREMGEMETTSVLKVDALAVNWPLAIVHQPLRVIFIDPPYPMTADSRLRSRFEQMITTLADLAEPEGLLMLRTETPNEFGELPGWLPPDLERYGKMLVHFYVK